MNRPVIVSGAKVLVYVNGKLFGRVASFGWASATGHKKIRTIDIPVPVELAPGVVDTTWNMTVLRTIGDGGLQGAGIAAQQLLAVKEKYFTIQLVERTSGLTLFRSDFNVVDSETWQVEAKNIVRGSLTGSGVTWNNEAG